VFDAWGDPPKGAQPTPPRPVLGAATASREGVDLTRLLAESFLDIEPYRPEPPSSPPPPSAAEAPAGCGCGAGGTIGGPWLALLLVRRRRAARVTAGG
jgi:uncharacterized protein (TIGR03382 family)